MVNLLRNQVVSLLRKQGRKQPFYRWSIYSGFRWSISPDSPVLQVLSEINEEGDTKVIFTWPILKDNIHNYQAFFTGVDIEISPHYISIDRFGSFDKADQRILMSATTQDDSFFITGLGFSKEATSNILTYPLQKWAGEKMILIPSLIAEDLEREIMIAKFSKIKHDSFGIVCITSSFEKARLFESNGAKVTNSESIYEEINKLKQGIFKQTIVLVNRYDGIDLPDNSCRILIIDSKPFFDSLKDRYEEICRTKSDLINIKIAQKIEQGLGRSVRGEKDYTIILLLGGDLIKFLNSNSSKKYFSAQTNKQIEIGFEIARMAKEETSIEKDNFKVLVDLINQSLKRNPDWKEFYQSEMDKIILKSSSNRIYEILEMERNAEKTFYNQDFDSSEKSFQQLVDFCTEDADKSWYLQSLARVKYFIKKSESISCQISAYKKNTDLLKPKEGIIYKKLEYISETRLKKIKEWFMGHTNYSELLLNIDSILDNLSFGVISEKFEAALQELGNLLGFLSQRPDKEFKKGPDNLWCCEDNQFILFECKNEVDETRLEITKSEAGQMNSHCGWFESTYGKHVRVKRIMIIHTRLLSSAANFTHKVMIMRKGKLNLLKRNVKAFFREFKDYNITEISDSKLQELLNIHNLDMNSINDLYFEEYYTKT